MTTGSLWRKGVASAALLLALPLGAQPRATAPLFPPLQRWSAAVRTGDAAALRGMYSVKPLALLLVSTGVIDNVSTREVNFWSMWKGSGLTRFALDPIRQQAIGTGLEEAFFQAAISVQTHSGAHTFYLFVEQIWMREAAGWRIISGSRTDLARLRQPDSLAANLFPVGADAERDIAAATARAGREHKRVLLVFGGNWCYDCHVLDLALRHSELTPLLEANYEVVDIDIGEFNRNLAVAARYHVPLAQGVPALAVLDAYGRLLYSSQNGEFQAARALGPEELIAFLNRWKPTR